MAEAVNMHELVAGEELLGHIPAEAEMLQLLSERRHETLDELRATFALIRTRAGNVQNWVGMAERMLFGGVEHDGITPGPRLSLVG